MQCRSNLLNRKNFEEVGVVLSFHIEFVHYTQTVSLKAPSHCHITGACVLPWFISRIYFKSFFFFFLHFHINLKEETVCKYLHVAAKNAIMFSLQQGKLEYCQQTGQGVWSKCSPKSLRK